MKRSILIVIDTNVLVCALRSSQGASYRLLRELQDGSVRAAISVPLFLEYEEVLGRQVASSCISGRSKELILDYLCAHAVAVEVHYLWRPYLNDADDEMVLEAALAAGTRWIVTHNTRDFADVGDLGIQAVTPREFLRKLESMP